MSKNNLLLSKLWLDPDPACQSICHHDNEANAYLFTGGSLQGQELPLNGYFQPLGTRGRTDMSGEKLNLQYS